MANVKYIVTYADTLEKISFFERFYPAVREFGCEIVLLTNRVSALFLSHNITIRLVTKTDQAKNGEEIPLTREVSDGSLTQNESEILFWSVYNAAKREVENNIIECIFIFGGTNTPEKAMQRLANDYGIKTLFFELSNIPGKIFVDPVGTNADSSLSKDNTIIDKYAANDSDYDAWKELYLANKNKYKLNPPQALKQRTYNPFYIVDHIGFKLFNVPYEDNRSFLGKLQRKLDRNTLIVYDDYNLSAGNYIFFPMQVSNDAQILFYSGMNNAEGIEYAVAAANREGKTLLVKPHPAEVNPNEISRILDLKKEHKFLFVNYPAVDILNYCDNVITINSTVGLEAMIMGKKVEFLGKTFYKTFTEARLKKYIMSYLIDFDFYLPEPITAEHINKMLQRIIKY